MNVQKSVQCSSAVREPKWHLLRFASWDPILENLWMLINVERQIMNYAYDVSAIGTPMVMWQTFPFVLCCLYKPVDNLSFSTM